MAIKKAKKSPFDYACRNIWWENNMKEKAQKRVRGYNMIDVLKL